MFRLLARLAPMAAALTLTVACSDDPVTTPTTPTPGTITETFSGTLTVNGAATHTFSTSAAGTVQATLTEVGPNSATIIGLLLGIWNGTGCTTVTANDTATQNTVVTGTATAAGQLCMRVYDVGRFTEPATYVVTVIHP